MNSRKDPIKLLALIAYYYGEISIGRCKELTGWDVNRIREETIGRVGRGPSAVDILTDISDYEESGDITFHAGSCDTLQELKNFIKEVS